VTTRDIALLKSRLAPARVSSGPSVLDLHSRDESYLPPCRPEVVIWPRCTEDVAAVVQLAAARRWAVTPWCAGTSLEGNPIPLRGGIVLDFAEMNRILEVRAGDLQADVEPGVGYRDLNEHLRHLGLFFPPDPGASACIGGMIGNNAAGIRTVAYGATRDGVLALEVVTGAGDVLRLGGRGARMGPGYDLVRLLVGSEGTLGIVTRATLRLRGLPPEHLTAMAVFPSIRGACEAVSETMRRGVDPAACELLDGGVAAEINRDRGAGLPEQPMLFLELHDLGRPALESRWEVLEEILRRHGAQAVERGIGPEERARVWAARHGALESIRRNHPGKAFLQVDACVPVSRFPELAEAARRALDDEGATGFIAGHAGDGNLHVALLVDRADPASFPPAQRVNEAVVARALAMGGTCAGEHGVGAAKLPYMDAEHGAALEVMRRVKAALDPRGILNPGKVLPD
jgi:D-lactate dehydrogenase (cytochrome)